MLWKEIEEGSKGWRAASVPPTLKDIPGEQSKSNRAVGSEVKITFRTPSEAAHHSSSDQQRKQPPHTRPAPTRQKAIACGRGGQAASCPERSSAQARRPHVCGWSYGEGAAEAGAWAGAEGWRLRSAPLRSALAVIVVAGEEGGGGPSGFREKQG